ncbi:MAG TPA: GMC family oxidoreductase [Opitutaceae bacterium]|nr:GMC family oxidoreductase [Opitutaceae bacterium]
MHIDARTLDPGTLIEGDLCIIGAGAAGITIALEYVSSGKKVILLEGGGLNVEAQMQALYHGESLDRPYYPLRSATLHYFGGTTGHWSGYCSPFDPIDFEKRDWVPHSGWPITRKDLDPFYARANKILELGPYEYDAAYWEGLDPDVRRLPLDGKVFFPKMWQFSPPTRMGNVYRDAILKAPNVHLHTYAKVVEIVPNEGLTAIEGLRTKTIEGREHRVRAKQYVLACGSIHNARLLLASNSRATAGVGNAHDLVGRYFMEHFEIIGAQVAFEKAQPFKLYTIPSTGKARARAELALMGEAQRQNKILNGTASFRPGPITGKEQSRFASFSDDAEANVKQRQAMKNTPGAGPVPEHVIYQMFTRQEQAPNPESRIVLSDEKDEIGMPRANLRWKFTGLDKRSVRVFYELLGKELGRAGLGRVQLMEWLLDGDDDKWPNILSGGWHHMGTARMHDDPKQGVVDANCKVHGLANLHVAGASVYTTGGAVNPTLTLVALSLRLADHLKTKVLV